MTERTLLASIDHQVIGTLHENQNIWAFEYHPDWLANADKFALSPHLSLQQGKQVDGGTTRPCQWYFDNLLPEEKVRELLASDAKLPDVSDAFALLAYYGRESAGSVTLSSPETYAQQDRETSLRLLGDEELNQRIINLPKIPLTHDAPKKMSLAGAQHKLPVVLRDGLLYEPSGGATSTHILKPDHPEAENYPHSVANEWFVMNLAFRLGFDVPNVTRRYVPAPVYLIERFDRVTKDGSIFRRHAIDGCQILNLAPTRKYTSWSLEALSDLAEHCRASAPARLRIFRWLVFCVIVGNGDSHLKNLSFLVDGNGIALSPFYDLLCDAVYDTRSVTEKPRWPDLSEFTSNVLGAKRYAEFTRTLLEDAGETLGIRRSTASRLIGELLSQMPAQADALLAVVEEENRALGEARPELVAKLTGELRLLRAVRRIIIQDMVTKLTNG